MRSPMRLLLCAERKGRIVYNDIWKVQSGSLFSVAQLCILEIYDRVLRWEVYIEIFRDMCLYALSYYTAIHKYTILLLFQLIFLIQYTRLLLCWPKSSFSLSHDNVLIPYRSTTHKIILSPLFIWNGLHKSFKVRERSSLSQQVSSMHSFLIARNAIACATSKT